MILTRLCRVPVLATLVACSTLVGVSTPALASAAPAPSAAVQHQPAGTLTSSISGTWTDALGATGTVTGTFTPTAFHRQGAGLAAIGTVHMVITDASGSTVRTIDQKVDVPVQTASGQAAGTDVATAALPSAVACDILNLDLGPLDLNLLGLRIQLNEIHLDITAVPGGGLLGDLLCAVSNLLNGGGALAQIAGLLNRILGLLQLG